MRSFGCSHLLPNCEGNRKGPLKHRGHSLPADQSASEVLYSPFHVSFSLVILLGYHSPPCPSSLSSLQRLHVPWALPLPPTALWVPVFSLSKSASAQISKSLFTSNGETFKSFSNHYFKLSLGLTLS